MRLLVVSLQLGQPLHRTRHLKEQAPRQAHYPFEKSEHAGLWIDNANLSVAEKSMVCYENAKSLLKL